MGLYGSPVHRSVGLGSILDDSYAPIASIGQPLPYEVRVFSTMNGPASFATFTSAGLILICMLTNRFRAMALIPGVVALLLSSYRTAWLSFAVGILFCLLFSPTRGRAGMLL